MQLTQTLFTTFWLAQMVAAAPTPESVEWQNDALRTLWQFRSWGRSNEMGYIPSMCSWYDKKLNLRLTENPDDKDYLADVNDCKKMHSFIDENLYYNLWFSSLQDVNKDGRAKGYYTVATHGNCKLALKVVKNFFKEGGGEPGLPPVGQPRIGYADISSLMSSAFRTLSDDKGKMMGMGWQTCKTGFDIDYGFEWLVYSDGKPQEVYPKIGSKDP